jgi:hypothetical protein
MARTIPTFKHVKIVPHPLKANKYSVFVVPFPHVPPFFGSLAQCIKAAQIADRHAADLLEK